MEEFDDHVTTSGVAANETEGDFLDRFVNYLLNEEYYPLQPIWNLRKGYEHILTSPLFPVVNSILFYFLCMIPFTIFDLYGKKWKWIQKYKIQPNKDVTWPMVKKAMALTLWNHIVYILPVSIAQWIWVPPIQLPDKAPGVVEFCWHHFAALAVFDLQYWAWHTLHHKVRFLYRHVHALHHQYHSPSSWVTQYLHPWELLSVGVFTTTSPWVFKAHPMTCWAFQNFAILVSVDAHIGYDLPFLPHHWLPFWGGSIKHDMHHQKPLTNFEPFFNWWDKLFGFDCPGQMAGGYKSKSLLDWEKKRKDQQKEKMTAPRSNVLLDTDKEASEIPLNQGGY